MNYSFKVLALLLISIHGYTLYARFSDPLNRVLAQLNPTLKRNNGSQEKKEYEQLQIECFVKEVEQYLTEKNLSISMSKNNQSTIRANLQDSGVHLLIKDNNQQKANAQRYHFSYSAQGNSHDVLVVSYTGAGLCRAYTPASKKQLSKKRATLKQAIYDFQNKGNILTSDAIDYFSWLFGFSRDNVGAIRVELLEANRRNMYYAALPAKLIIVAAAAIGIGTGLYKKIHKDKKPQELKVPASPLPL